MLVVTLISGTIYKYGEKRSEDVSRFHKNVRHRLKGCQEFFDSEPIFVDTLAEWRDTALIRTSRMGEL